MNSDDVSLVVIGASKKISCFGGVLGAEDFFGHNGEIYQGRLIGYNGHPCFKSFNLTEENSSLVELENEINDSDIILLFWPLLSVNLEKSQEELTTLLGMIFKLKGSRPQLFLDLQGVSSFKKASRELKENCSLLHQFNFQPLSYDKRNSFRSRIKYLRGVERKTFKRRFKHLQKDLLS